MHIIFNSYRLLAPRSGHTELAYKNMMKAIQLDDREAESWFLTKSNLPLSVNFTQSY